MTSGRRRPICHSVWGYFPQNRQHFSVNQAVASQYITLANLKRLSIDACCHSASLLNDESSGGHIPGL